MENIRDWCISRQIWWGHRLPVYYCRRCQREGFEEAENKREEKGNKRGIIVARTRVERCPYCGSDEISQEEDVLDTWFSSWLWPFSTLGWPEKSEDLDYFYPTSTLVTAPEIIFFWVARMIMAGIKFMGEIPFRDVYIHGTIRDAKGRKMSKSLGNTIDPLQIINELGADALRFSLVFITATGQDVFLSREKFLVGRNFANKIWNASRYILAKTQGKEDLCLEKIPEDLELKERWILSRLHRTIEEVSRALEQYRFQEAESRVYDFFWHQFCDWYIELTKPSHQEITQKVLVYVLEKTMRLLHPFMPFISEEIWQRIKEGSKKKSIMLASWPKKEQRWIDESAERDMNLIIEITQVVRNLLAELNIKEKAEVSLVLVNFPAHLSSYLSYISQLTRIDNITCKKEGVKEGILSLVKDTEVYLLLEKMEVEREKGRIRKKIEEIEKDIQLLSIRLANKEFVQRAPAEVIERNRARKREMELKKKRLEEILSRLCLIQS